MPAHDQILPTHENAEMESETQNSDEEEHSLLTVNSPIDAPTFVTQDVAAGLLLKLREKHRLSQAAVDEVVQIVSTVSDHMVIEALSAVRGLGESHCMDINSPFFQDLPETLESVSNPLAQLGTAYRQQTYVAKNFPYVVSS